MRKLKHNPEIKKSLAQIAAYVELLRLRSERVVGVFDIGTRGVRILVAPKQVPEKWTIRDKELGTEDTFCFHGHITNLGESFDRGSKTLPLNAESLNATIDFIDLHTRNLRNAGVDADDISLVGTAIFRWLLNQEQVFEKIRAGTGLEMLEIRNHFEAELMIRSVPEIETRRSRYCPMRDDDLVLMIDQGGGSLEVTWMRWRERLSKQPKLQSQRDENLGTNALRNRFFMENRRGELIDPATNKNPVRTQADRIASEALELVKRWPLPDSAAVMPSKVYVYAVGSAITEAAKVSGPKGHGKRMNIEKIDQRYAERCKKFEESKSQVMSVWKARKGEAGSGTEAWAKDLRELDKDLAVLYGLPVYKQVLKALGIEELTVSGYGLAFGFYLNKYLSYKAYCSVQPVCTRPYIFVSYSHKDTIMAYAEIAFLDALGARLWYDSGLELAESYRENLGKRIREAAAVVVLVTPRSVLSKEVLDEVDCAHSHGVPVLPVILQDTPFPDSWYHLANKQNLSKVALHELDYQRKLVEFLMKLRVLREN